VVHLVFDGNSNVQGSDATKTIYTGANVTLNLLGGY